MVWVAALLVTPLGTLVVIEGRFLIYLRYDIEIAFLIVALIVFAAPLVVTWKWFSEKETQEVDTTPPRNRQASESGKDR